jgi:CubicO group peptidase (beta-lactamase class C family)
MKNWFVVSLALMFIMFPVYLFGQASSHQITQLDSIFKSWTANTPGGTVCVIHHGNIIYKKAFGLADIEKKLPNTISTRYELASNAKQFTAMCIALLEEQGKLSSEDELNKYYPELKIADPIKIKNLIDHTSGLRDASVLAILSGKMNLKGEVKRKYNTKAYYLECMMRETDLNYPVGSEMAYTNFNYVLLGDIVEKVSGQSLADFADSAIFKPLGMTQTLVRDKHPMDIPGEATGYLYKRKKFKRQKAFGGVVGDHNLVSSIDDLIQWQLNFVHNKLGKQDPKLIEKVCTSSRLNNDSLSHYGYGIWVHQYRGLLEIGHGGDDGQHTSVLKRFPDHDLIVVVLSNSSRFDETQGKAYAIVDLLLKDYIKTVPKNGDLRFIRLPESELKSHVGVYTRIDERGLGHLINITFVDSSLYVSPHYYWKGLKLSAVSPQHFVAKNDMGYRVQVRFPSDSGNVLTESFRENPAKQYTRREDRAITYGDYSGAYKNKSTGATIKVKHKKNRIVARKGIIKIPLIPFAQDQFYAPANDALFIFKRGIDGRISGFKANAYDFRNFDFTKERR